jgi:hypothetical protein
MDALQQIFVLITDAIPKFCAQMTGYFVLFFTRPYPISKLTMRTLRSQNMTSVTLLLFTYTAFALVLGIPSTGRHIVAFEGGLTSSLGAIWRLDTKGREFYYLIVFVLTSTIFTLILCEISKTQLPKMIRRRTEFFDMFNIFIAFSIGWFMIVSLICSFFLGLFSIHLNKWRSISSLRDFFDRHGIPDITDILVQPALMFLFVPLVFFANRLFNKWAGRRSLYKIVTEGTSEGVVTEIVKRRIDVFPGLSFILVLVGSSLLLAFMANALFLQVEGDKETFIDVSCQLKGDKLDKLFVSAVFENNTTNSFPIKTVFIKLLDKDNSGDKDKQFGLRIEPGDIAWLSEEGLFLEAREKRYYRLLLPAPRGLLSKLSPESLICSNQNDSKGDFQSDLDRNKFQHPVKVEGDSFSVKAP